MKIGIGVPVLNWRIPSRSEPGIFRTVSLLSNGKIDCDCPGSALGKRKCWHIKEAYNRLKAINNMEKEINENIILIFGKANIPPDSLPPERGDVVLLVKGGVKKVEDIDNEDGTFDRIYKVKQIDVKVCENPRPSKKEA